MDTPAPPPQRAWRALCPNCGAPVEFHSAASASAVCSFCRSTLVRDGEALRRIGQVAELFDDHSPLRLGAGGRYQGLGFTLVGRLQYRYAEGCWNEWHALFDSGRSGWLAEDNGRYVFAFDAPLQESAPGADAIAVGSQQLLDGRVWQFASKVRASLQAAEGELPRPPKLQGEFAVVELRNAQGEVGTLDYSDAAHPQWSVGRSVTLAELAMSGLAEVSEKTLGSRAFECPGCGAPLEVTLATTRSVACRQCDAVVDVSQGVGAELKHYKQNNAGDSGLEPLLPLGRTGTLALGGPPLPWQVVGYLERCDVPQDREEEQTFWREYLLYHRTAGFAFLVDAEDGWSWVRPLTGAPQRTGSGKQRYQGIDYQQLYQYTARTTYVLGEFYWQVQRGQQSLNTDYHGTGTHARKRLNREQSGSEVVWSAGETLDAATLAKAFGLPPAGLARDVAPRSSEGSGCLKHVVWMVLVLVILAFASCDWVFADRYDCSAYVQRVQDADLGYRQCVAAVPGDPIACGALQQELNSATAAHQRCLNANTRSSWSSGSSGSSSSGSWSWGGHK